MSRYGKYFLQHLLWLEDEYCHYYVQGDTWGYQDIIDVECVIFEFRDDAESWILQCVNWDRHMSLRSLRNFLAKNKDSRYFLQLCQDGTKRRYVLTQEGQDELDDAMVLKTNVVPVQLILNRIVKLFRKL